MNFFISTAVVLFYVLGFVVDRAAGFIFGLLVLAALMMVVTRKSSGGHSFAAFSKKNWPINLAMAAPLVAALAHLASKGSFDGKTIDFASRFALFTLVFWILQSMPYRHMKYVGWAFSAAAILAAIKMYVLTDGGIIRYSSDFIPIIVFAGLILLIGFFTMYSIVWDTGKKKFSIGLKVSAGGLAIYAAYISGSRGPWLMLLVLVMIACVGTKAWPLRYRLAILISAVILGFGLTQFNGPVRERLVRAKEDIQEYSTGSDVDTSLGVRFQIWRGSWIIFKEHPIFGVGVRDYQSALEDVARRHIISPVSATFVHSHNEVLFMMARFGLIGLVSLLAFYFVPLFYFLQGYKEEDREIRSIVLMGIGLCIGVMVLGLTDVLLLWWEIPPFYTITIAFFLTYIGKRKDYLSHMYRAA